MVSLPNIIKKGLMAKLRPDWDEYFINIAREVSRRATCLRRRYGAVLVNSLNEPAGTGYCGTPRGFPDCLFRGTCFRRDNNIPSGTNYDKCFSVHAEVNVILAAGNKARGSRLYIYGQDLEDARNVLTPPLVCLSCAKILRNSEITTIVEYSENWDKSASIKNVTDSRALFELRLREAGLSLTAGKY